LRRCAPACPAGGNARCIAVAVLNAHYEVADDGNARTIAGELLVGLHGIVLLRLDELVVEVKVAGFARQELAGAHEYLHEKPVQSHCCIEVVTASRLGGVARVGGAQFFDAAKNDVRGSGAEGGMEREMGHHDEENHPFSREIGYSDRIYAIS